jgi:membrane glycosyltransferase
MKAETPAIVERANALQREYAARGYDDEDALLALHRNPSLCDNHEAMLPPAERRERGVIDAERVLAQAKVMDAETIDEAARWLKPKERMVVLHDRALLDQAMRLKPAPAPL